MPGFLPGGPKRAVCVILRVLVRGFCAMKSPVASAPARVQRRRSLWTKTAGARDCLRSSSVIKVGAEWPWALLSTIAVFPE